MDQPRFWEWLFCGEGRDSPGYVDFVDRWLFFHVLVGIFLSFAVRNDLAEIAKTVTIPFASVLVGITFAWSGNITALLTTKEISSLTRFHGEGIKKHVFVVQRAILVVFVVVLLWAFAGLGMVEGWFWKFILLTISSVAVRESWGVIMFAQLLTIYREEISRRNDTNGN